MRTAIRRAARRLGYDVTRVGADDGLEPIAGAPCPDVLDADEHAALVAEYREHALSRLPRGIWPVAQTPQDEVKDIDLTRFRSDNAYVWQSRGASAMSFAVGALWAQAHDDAAVLDRCDEDGAFGAECLTIDGRTWSRDLLDSVLEINAIAPVLARLPAHARVVDIGAGYGRLLHRLASWSPELRLVGVDGVALSTALARGYLGYRGLADRASVLSLPEAEALAGPIDLAINVHSFSEMSREAVGWWLDWLVARDARYLFIVPNQPGPRLNDGTDLSPDLEARGFSLVERREKYVDPVISAMAWYPAEYLLYAGPAERP